MSMSPKTISDLEGYAEMLKQHPFLTPLQAFRSLTRIHEHSRRECGGRSPFYIGKLGELLGLAMEVRVFEASLARAVVERSYRAATGGAGTYSSRSRGKPTRYVIEDPDGHSRIVTY